MKLKRLGISKLSDNQLVWLYAETREKKYAGELYLRYMPLAYGVCLYEFEEAAEAKEAVISIFNRVCEKLVQDAEQCEDFRTWICKELDSLVAAHIPEEKRRPYDRQEQTLSIGARGYAALLAEGDREVVKEIDDPLRKLSLPQKQALKLFFVRGKSFADIAADTGILIENVRAHIVRGLEALAGSGDETASREGK